MPAFLEGTVTPQAYERWLLRRAAAHVKRDRMRGHTCTGAAYRESIHQAVVSSEGRDAYTGEKLDWHLISTYNNEDSELRRHAYKAEFALLPSVDHVAAEATAASFKIWSITGSEYNGVRSIMTNTCSAKLVGVSQADLNNFFHRSP